MVALPSATDFNDDATMSLSSQRPRDRLGRPLNVGDPRAFPTVEDRSDIDGPDAWTEGLNYLDRGLPFHAHEVFEQRWKCCPEAERDCWQALAQWGAAITQRDRGNAIGRQRLAARALERFQRAQAHEAVPGYIDAEAVIDSLSQLT